jgi:type IV secretory pathway VirB10-like protein
MKTACGIAVTTVFLACVTGCSHKVDTAPPVQAQAPLGPPANMVHIPALPSLPPPEPREVVLVVPQEEPQAPARPRRVTHHKTPAVKTASTADAPAAADKSAQTQASAGTPSDISPIGQLTSGGDATNIQQRRDIEQLINNTESGLNNIKRSLNNNEQETSTQIKSFLIKAKQALTDNDLDGAHTLATKAKVLLDELTKK